MMLKHLVTGMLMTLCAVLWVSPPLSQAAAPETVRVRLFDQVQDKQAVTLTTPAKLTESTAPMLPAQTVFQCQGGQVRWPKGKLGRVVLVSNDGKLPIGLKVSEPASAKAPRQYAGRVILTATPQAGGLCRLHVENDVPLNAYVASVVSSETGGGWPLEALKAQAVLTQTRLAARKTKVETVSDTTQDELYLGEGRVRPEVREAVQAVWHQVLAYENRPVQVYYHASCGGHTADGSWFNPKLAGATPYLVAKPCPYCKIGPFQKATRFELTPAQWQGAFPKISFPTGLPQVSQADAGGHPLWITTGQGGQPMSGYQFWLKAGQRLGWDKLPGSRFQLAAGRSKGNLVVSSTGAGHGVGLCQWGAHGMAKQGKSVTDILAFYFPGTTLRPW